MIVTINGAGFARLKPVPCDSYCGSGHVISSEILRHVRHGGPRANAGGPRANSGGFRPGAGGKPKPVIAVTPPSRLLSLARWFVYQTEPQAEQVAAHELTRAGYRGYLPLIAIRKSVTPKGRATVTVHKVLLPRFVGYGFVELGPADRSAPICQTAGIAKLLLNSNGQRAPIPVGELEKHMADDERLCDLKLEPIPAGNRVTILAGAMASCHGKVLACDGLVTTVELVMFGRVMGVRFDRASVEAV